MVVAVKFIVVPCVGVLDFLAFPLEPSGLAPCLGLKR
jgi:hypothetical protein